MSSDQTIGLLFELVKPLRAVEVDLREFLISQLGLLDGPLGQRLVEGIEADCFTRVHLGPVLLRIKRFDQFAVHEQEQIEALDVGRHVALPKVRIELLQREVLENLLPFGHEETSDFLDSCLLFEKFSVFELGTVVRVVAHEVLCQENAGVETSPDAWINFIYINRCYDIS